jgi:hypothetical protein
VPISHVSKVYAVSDIKMWPVLTDPAGGATTYGTGIDVPGAKTMAITGDVNTVELRGDNTSLDRASAMSNVSVAIEFAKISLDLLAAWFAATVTPSGTTPNQKSIWTLAGTTALSYVGITGKAVGADILTGDVQFTVHKAILTSFPEMGLEEEDYRTHSVEFGAMPALGTGNKWISVTLNETGAALAAPA